MKIQRLVFFTLASICAPLCFAQTGVPSCPPTINEAPPATPPNTFWEGMIYPGRGEVRLESIMMFDGHPREMASLAPDEDHSSAKEITSVWHLHQNDTQRGIWMACTYSNTNAIRTVRVPRQLRRCRLTQGRGRSEQSDALKSFSCE